MLYHTSIVTICCNSDTQHASCQYLEYKIIAQAMDIILQGRWNDTWFQTTTLSHIKQATLSQSKRDESDSKTECILYQPMSMETVQEQTPRHQKGCTHIWTNQVQLAFNFVVKVEGTEVLTATISNRHHQIIPLVGIQLL